MEIETKRTIIRPFKESDLCNVYEYASQKEVAEKVGWKTHTSIEQTAAILEAWMEQGRKHAIVLKENGKVIGHISIDPDSEEHRNDTKELGMALNKLYHKRGIMTEAVRATRDFLFRSGINTIWMCCFQDNLPSKRTIEKCGFTFVKEGIFHAVNLGGKEIPSFEYRLCKDEWGKI